MVKLSLFTKFHYIIIHNVILMPLCIFSNIGCWFCRNPFIVDNAGIGATSDTVHMGGLSSVKFLIGCTFHASF